MTGKNIWELQEGGLLFGGLPKEFISFPHLLRQQGYITGLTGKGYGPANLESDQYHNQPIANKFDELTMDSPEGISTNNYSGNFEVFLSQREKDTPFFFWFGATEPHRRYQDGAGIQSGKDITAIEVPGFLPDNQLVRSDIADYYTEIEWFDTHLGRMIETLERFDELDNTIIIVTSDNGMPFPRAKTTCYDYGTHMPLAVYWGDKVKPGRIIDDFVSFIDFAPTILEAAGIQIPTEMTGNSFLDVMLGEGSGQVDTTRNRVFTALERHTYCRPEGLPYPIRTIRKGDWLYMVNFEPDRWPAGDADYFSPHQGYYGDIDAGPTREFIITNKDDAEILYYYDLSVKKRPDAELYNVKEDPFQLQNLASAEGYSDLCDSLRAELFDYLRETGDPRIEGNSPWDDYPYYFEGYDKRHIKPVGQRDL